MTDMAQADRTLRTQETTPDDGVFDKHRQRVKEMTDQEKLKIFCQGYLEAVIGTVGSASSVDDWVLWDGYDINLTGCEYDQLVTSDHALAVSVYRAGYEVLPSTPLYRFAVEI